MELNKKRKIKNSEVLLYGLGGVATTLINRFKGRFQMIFLSDVAGLSVGLVGSLMMFITLFDAVNDPIIGGICDRTNTRFGRYRPHMMMGTVCLAFVTISMFSVPSFGGNGRIVYYTLLMMLYSVFYTQQTIPWQSLNSVYTSDTNQRNILLASRQLFGFLSTAFVGFATLPLVAMFTKETTGWRITALIFSVMSVSCMFLAAHGARNVDYPGAFSNKDDKKITLKTQLKMFTNNRPLIFAGLIFGLQALAGGVLQSISVYYFKYVIEDPSLVGKSSIALLVLSFVAVPLTPILLKKFDKKPVIYGSLIVSLAFPVAIMFLRYEISKMFMFVLFSITSAMLGIANFAALSLVPDCTDYTELKFDAKCAGIVNSCITFMLKFCTSFSSMIIGNMLARVNYTVETAFTKPVTDMILNISSYVPVIIVAATIVATVFYPINRKAREDVQQQLAQRNSANDSETKN